MFPAIDTAKHVGTSYFRFFKFRTTLANLNYSIDLNSSPVFILNCVSEINRSVHLVCTNGLICNIINVSSLPASGSVRCADVRNICDPHFDAPINVTSLSATYVSANV